MQRTYRKLGTAAGALIPWIIYTHEIANVAKGFDGDPATAALAGVAIVPLAVGGYVLAGAGSVVGGVAGFFGGWGIDSLVNRSSRRQTESLDDNF